MVPYTDKYRQQLQETFKTEKQICPWQWQLQQLYHTTTKILFTTRLIQSREHFICSCQIFKLCFWKSSLRMMWNHFPIFSLRSRISVSVTFSAWGIGRVWSSFFLSFQLQWPAMTKVYLLHLRLRRSPVAKGSLRNLSYSCLERKLKYTYLRHESMQYKHLKAKILFGSHMKG